MPRRPPFLRRGWTAAGGLALVSLLPGVAAARPAVGHAALVRLPFPQDDGSLTPYTFELGYPLVTLVYDTLLWRDAGGEPRPWLARSVDTSADGRQVTIRLNDGVRWQDGSALTAGDVAFTFHFVATHPHPRFTSELDAVSSVVVTGPLQVVVKLRAPAAGFADLALADVPILPAHLWQGLPPGTVSPPGLPVGSGPYRLVEYRAGALYRFQANTDYFRGAPAVQTIEVPIVHDRDAMVRAFQAGALDALPVPLSAAEADSVRGLGTRIETGSSYSGTVLMLNLRRPPFDRADVRQAVAESVDLSRVAAAAGGAVPADRGYLHPQSDWASKGVEHRYDPNAARRVLAGLGVAPVAILAPDNEPAKLAAAEQVALALQRAGLAATASTTDPRALGSSVGEDGSAPTFQAAIWSTPALVSYDPSLLGRLFGSPPAGTLNYTGYSSRAFDALATRIETTTDVAARTAAVADAVHLLATDAPVVPLFFSAGTFAVHPQVYGGWTLVRGAGILDKRSFLVPPAPVGAPAALPAEPGAVAGGNGGGPSVLQLLFLASAGAAVVILLLIGGLNLRDRSTRRR